MNYRWLAVGILVLVLAVPVSAKATDGDYNLHQVGTIPLGTFFNIIHDDVLYTGEGNAVRCYNISPGVNLSAITYKSFDGQIFFEEPVTGMNISGGKLYVTTETMLNIASLDDKFHPASLGNITYVVTNQGFSDLRVIGNYAYVGGTRAPSSTIGKLHVFDISNPAAPTLSTSVDLGESSIHRLYQEGDYLYGGYRTVSAYPMLSIWDISTPGTPVSVINTNITTKASVGYSGIAYKNNTLYLASYNTQLDVIDITNRSDPIVIDTKTFTYGAGPVDAQVVGDYLYVSIRYGGIRVYDVTSPIPSLVGSEPTSTQYTEQISSNGNVATMSRWTSGTMIYNTTTKSSPTIITNINTPSETYALDVQTLGTLDVLAHAGRNLGNWYWNITDPETAYLNAPLTQFGIGNPREFVIPWEGNYSYATYGSNGVGAYVVNLTGLESEGFEPPYSTYTVQAISILANDSRIWVGDRSCNFCVYDNTLKDTAPPTLISITNLTRIIDPCYYALKGKMIQYKTNYIVGIRSSAVGYGLSIINITDENSPVETIFDNGTRYYDIDYDEESGILYTLHLTSLKQLDVSNIDDWHFNTGSVAFSSFQPKALARNGTDLFVAGRVSPNVKMYSFYNPLAPVLVDKATSIGGTEPEGGQTAVFNKGYLYVGEGVALTIYKVEPSGEAPIVLPVVAWEKDKHSGTAPLTVQFTDSSYDPSIYNASETGDISSWSWDFDDGSYSTLENPSHTFTSNGNYDVTLTVTGAEGINTSAAQTVAVQATSSNFYANKTYNATPPLTVEFTSLEENGIDFLWDFDNDGETDETTRNATYTYTESGIYTVNYTVINGSEWDPKVRANYIIVGGGECSVSADLIPIHNANPYLGGSTNLTWTNARLAATATAADNNGTYIQGYHKTSSTFEGMYINLYRGLLTWNTSVLAGKTITGGYVSMVNYYKGNTLGSPNLSIIDAYPVDPMNTATSDFNRTNFNKIAEDALYDSVVNGQRINLTLINTTFIDTGATTSIFIVTNWDADNEEPSWVANKLAYIKPYSGFNNATHPYYDPAYNPYLVVNYTDLAYQTAPAPVADFIPNTTYGDYPLAVSFYDASTNNPTIWNWSFGEGNFSDDQHPSHIFDSLGTFEVNLTVTNEAGSDSVVINVQTGSIPPVADFSCTPLSGVEPLEITCTDTSTNTPIAWNWSVGSEVYYTTQNITHTYYVPGSKTIALTATNADGSDTETKTDYITVSGITPVASFSSDETNGTIPLSIQFYDLSTDASSWYWEFGDGNTSYSQEPSHIYESAGDYTVNLQVTSVDSISVWSNQSGYITAEIGTVPPTANFTGIPTSGNAPLTVTFTDTSDAEDATGYNWSFGDDEYNETADPVHIYATFGSYNVNMTVTNASGSDYELKSAYITVYNTTPVANFTKNYAIVRIPKLFIVNDTSTNTPSSWSWTFGEGTTATTNNATHEYIRPGTFNVALNVSNDGGYNITSQKIRVVDDRWWIYMLTPSKETDFVSIEDLTYTVSRELTVAEKEEIESKLFNH